MKKSKANAKVGLVRIQDLLNRLIHKIVGFEKVKSLDGSRHPLLPAQVILLHPKHSGAASHADRNHGKLIGQGHQQFDFLMFNDWKIGVEKYASRTYVPGFATNFETCIREYKGYRQLERKPMRNTPILGQSSSSSSIKAIFGTGLLRKGSAQGEALR